MTFALTIPFFPGFQINLSLCLARSNRRKHTGMQPSEHLSATTDHIKRDIGLTDVRPSHHR